MRVAKKEIYEFSLSEIYNIKESQGFIELPDLLTQDESSLENYLSNIFINFYSEGEKYSTQFEIEC